MTGHFDKWATIEKVRQAYKSNLDNLYDDFMGNANSIGRVAFGPDYHSPSRINYPNNLKDSLLRLMEGKERTIQAVTEVLNDEGYKATINVPGVDPKEIEVRLYKNEIWVQQENQTLFMTSLAENLDTEKVKAVYEFGALNITVPSKEVQPVEIPASVEIPVEIRAGNVLSEGKESSDGVE